MGRPTYESMDSPGNVIAELYRLDALIEGAEKGTEMPIMIQYELLCESAVVKFPEFRSLHETVKEANSAHWDITYEMGRQERS